MGTFRRTRRVVAISPQEVATGKVTEAALNELGTELVLKKK